MDVSLSKLHPTNNKRLLRRKLMTLSKKIRHMKEETGEEMTLFLKTDDNKYFRVNGDPNSPVCEVEESNQELLDWMKHAAESKKIEERVEAARKEKREEFEKLMKCIIENHVRETEEAAGSECTEPSRDGSSTASVSSART